MTRRTVRVDPQFFSELDAQLGDARGPNGELPQLYPDRDDYRYLVAGGSLVFAVVVVGQLIDGDSISLFGIEIDLNGPR